MLGYLIALEITRWNYFLLIRRMCWTQMVVPCPHITCVLLFRLSEIQMRDNPLNRDLWRFPSQSFRWADDPEALVALLYSFLKVNWLTPCHYHGFNCPRNDSCTHIVTRPSHVKVYIKLLSLRLMPPPAGCECACRSADGASSLVVLIHVISPVVPHWSFVFPTSRRSPLGVASGLLV